jgi:hypothetical protein
VAKAYAVAALDLLRLNNAQAYKHIVDKGGMQMLEGLKQYGAGSCRDRARARRQRGSAAAPADDWRRLRRLAAAPCSLTRRCWPISSQSSGAAGRRLRRAS